jgi:simple sugar transport system ATP-binding protein
MGPTSAGPGLDPGRPAAIAAIDVTKRFPGVLANDAVDFHVDVGEVHTILGENGAGKSTLAAMLCGLYQPDDGQILRLGKPVRLRSPRDGLAEGIGMVHQHFRLVERFTVAENVVLGDPQQSVILHPREIESRVAEIGEQFGLPVDPEARVADLTVGERQRVEIVKMLYRGADVLLLDEPTAVLGPKEVDTLFETVHAMTAEGKAIVFISHKLGEVMAVSDRVTVMRAGEVTGEVATADTNQRHLAELMVGRPVEIETRRGAAPADVALAVRDLTVSQDGQTTVDSVDLEVRRGEIFGIAGVAGNGQRTLAHTLAGMIRPASGSVEIGGTDVTGKGTTAARRAGVSFVPEDRLGTGLVPDLSLSDNMILTRPRRFFVNRRRARAETAVAIEEYEIKTPSTEIEARLLSGGNAQKVLLARELAGLGTPGGPQVVIVSSPTRGLDVGAAEFVRGLLDEARARGAAVLMISEDLEEVRSLSDRIAVLYRGHVALEGSTDEIDIDQIAFAIAGVEVEEVA